MTSGVSAVALASESDFNKTPQKQSRNARRVSCNDQITPCGLGVVITSFRGASRGEGKRESVYRKACRVPLKQRNNKFERPQCAFRVRYRVTLAQRGTTQYEQFISRPK